VFAAFSTNQYDQQRCNGPKGGDRSEDRPPKCITPLAALGHPVKVDPRGSQDPRPRHFAFFQPLATVPTPMRHCTVVGRAPGLLELFGRPSSFMDDDDRAFCVCSQVLADGADQQARDFAVPSRPYNQEAGPKGLRSADQALGRQPLFGVGLDGDGRVVVSYQLCPVRENGQSRLGRVKIFRDRRRPP
jgi:hypothetical protein